MEYELKPENGEESGRIACIEQGKGKRDGGGRKLPAMWGGRRGGYQIET